MPPGCRKCAHFASTLERYFASIRCRDCRQIGSYRFGLPTGGCEFRCAGTRGGDTVRDSLTKLQLTSVCRTEAG